jgi:copper chaperone CopZ
MHRLSRHLPYCTGWLILVSLAALAGDAPEQKKETLFQVEGMECASCVYMVQQSLTETAGVENVQVDQGFLGGTAKVSYDPKRVTEHQIAQAVRDTVPLHGSPYLAVLQINVSGYEKGDNAGKIKALFESGKQWVDLIVLDEGKGQLLIRFHPLEPDAKGAVPEGWSLAPLTELLRKLDLRYEIVEPRPE